MFLYFYCVLVCPKGKENNKKKEQNIFFGWLPLTQPPYIMLLVSKITVGENIIGAPKMLNNYSAILAFSIAFCRIIALILLCFIFGIISLPLHFISLSMVIAIVIALSRSYRRQEYVFLYFLLLTLRFKKSDNYT